MRSETVVGQLDMLVDIFIWENQRNSGVARDNTEEFESRHQQPNGCPPAPGTARATAFTDAVGAAVAPSYS